MTKKYFNAKERCDKSDQWRPWKMIMTTTCSLQLKCDCIGSKSSGDLWHLLETWWPRNRSILAKTSLKVWDYCHLRFSYFFSKNIKFIFFSWFPEFNIDFSVGKWVEAGLKISQNRKFLSGILLKIVIFVKFWDRKHHLYWYPLKTRNRNIKILKNFWLIFILLEHPKITVLTPVFCA